MILQDPHQQRQLEPHQRADNEDDAEKSYAEPAQVGERQKQQRGRNAARERDAQLNLDEPAPQTLVDESRQPSPHAQGGKICADDQRELSDRVAQHVARQGPRQKLVHEAARRDHQHVEIEQEKGPRGS